MQSFRRFTIYSSSDLSKFCLLLLVMHVITSSALGELLDVHQIGKCCSHNITFWATSKWCLLPGAIVSPCYVTSYILCYSEDAAAWSVIADSRILPPGGMTEQMTPSVNSSTRFCNFCTIEWYLLELFVCNHPKLECFSVISARRSPLKHILVDSRVQMISSPKSLSSKRLTACGEHRRDERFEPSCVLTRCSNGELFAETF